MSWRTSKAFIYCSKGKTAQRRKEEITGILESCQRRVAMNEQADNRQTRVSPCRSSSASRLFPLAGPFPMTIWTDLKMTMSNTHTHPSSSGHAEGGSPDKTTIHIPPLTAPNPLLRSLPPLTHLPADLLDLLNQTYFLHLLANDPSKLLPPGKSLLSVLSQPNIRQRQDDEPPTLHDKVEEMVHKAFWDEVLHHLNVLSSLLIAVFARH